MPKTTGVFAKLTDPGQYTGSQARRHGGGFAVSPAAEELSMPPKRTPAGEVTLNVHLAGEAEGGTLVFCGLDGAADARGRIFITFSAASSTSIKAASSAAATPC